MSNKKWFIGLMVFMLAISGSVFAQDGSKKDQAAKAITDTMKVNLSLNDDQYKKIYDINEAFVTKLAGIKESGSGKLAKLQQFKKADEERDGSLKPILTDEQYKKYQANKQARKEQMKENYRNSKN